MFPRVLVTIHHLLYCSWDSVGMNFIPTDPHSPEDLLKTINCIHLIIFVFTFPDVRFKLHLSPCLSLRSIPHVFCYSSCQPGFLSQVQPLWLPISTFPINLPLVHERSGNYLPRSPLTVLCYLGPGTSSRTSPRVNRYSWYSRKDDSDTPSCDRILPGKVHKNKGQINR